MQNVQAIRLQNNGKEYVVVIRDGKVDRIRVAIGRGWAASYRDVQIDGTTGRRIAALAT